MCWLLCAHTCHRTSCINASAHKAMMCASDVMTRVQTHTCTGGQLDQGIPFFLKNDVQHVLLVRLNDAQQQTKEMMPVCKALHVAFTRGLPGCQIHGHDIIPMKQVIDAQDSTCRSTVFGFTALCYVVLEHNAISNSCLALCATGFRAMHTHHTLQVMIVASPRAINTTHHQHHRCTNKEIGWPDWTNL